MCVCLIGFVVCCLFVYLFAHLLEMGSHSVPWAGWSSVCRPDKSHTSLSLPLEIWVKGMCHLTHPLIGLYISFDASTKLFYLLTIITYIIAHMMCEGYTQAIVRVTVRG